MKPLAVISSLTLAVALHASDGVDIIIARERMQNDEKIARLKHESDVKSAIIYGVAIVIAGGLVGFGLYRGLQSQRAKA
jgi:hypothetical protein